MKTLTVRELITKLQTYNPTSPIMLYEDGSNSYLGIVDTRTWCGNPACQDCGVVIVAGDVVAD